MNPDLYSPSLKSRIILALEARPAIEIPPDFAARVARSLPAPCTAILTPARYGQRAALTSLLVLLALILALAHRATAFSVMGLSVESLFCAQFSVVAVWLVGRNAGYTFTSFF